MTVCFVCTGNICRSPIGEQVLRRSANETLMADGSLLAEHLRISSAGTSSWHVGDPMDSRASAVLAAHGYADHGHRARVFEPAWLAHTDLVVAMARNHQQILRGLACHHVGRRDEYEAKLVLLRSYDLLAGGEADVADPYYGEVADFEACLAVIEAGCRGLAANLSTYLSGQPTKD